MSRKEVCYDRQVQELPYECLIKTREQFIEACRKADTPEDLYIFS